MDASNLISEYVEPFALYRVHSVQRAPDIADQVEPVGKTVSTSTSFNRSSVLAAVIYDVFVASSPEERNTL